jgi:hypothetical protein
MDARQFRLFDNVVMFMKSEIDKHMCRVRDRFKLTDAFTIGEETTYLKHIWAGESFC